jgi:hypothetical protein
LALRRLQYATHYARGISYLAKICLWRSAAHRVDDDGDDTGESDASDTRRETSLNVDRGARSSRKAVRETRGTR